MVRQALRVTVGGDVQELDLDAGDSLRVLQEAVGGSIERVDLGDFDLYLNEDGKGKGLHLNRTATVLFTGSFGPIDFIVGDVVFAGGVDDEGEMLGISEIAASRVRDCAAISHLR